MRLFLYALFIAALAVPVAPSHAQVDFGFGEEEEEEGPKTLNPYDDKYKPDLKAEREQGASLVPNYIYYAGFLRKPNANPDDIDIRIISPGMVTGCLDIEEPSIEIKSFAPTLELHMTEGYIDADIDTARYAHYDCDVKTGMSQIDIGLSKKQLIKDDIKKITLFTKSIGPFTDIEMDIKDNRVVYESSLRDFSRLGIPLMAGATQSHTQWDYPKNTIVLSSNAVDMENPEMRDKIIAMATSKGLMPLESVIQGYETPYRLRKNIYVVDTAERFANDMKTESDVINIGNIKTSELYFGPDGPYDKTTAKPIYARLPGIYE